MHDPTFWILARASGFTAYILLTLTVAAGIVLKSRPFGNRLRPATVTDTHRTLALLGLSSLAIHATTLVLDTTVPLSIWAVFVPGLSSYRPLWVSVGVLTAELMLIIYASFSLRKRIGVKNWRRLHWATYALFLGATVHGLMSGSDSSRTWALAIYLGAIGAVALAATWRFLAPLTKGETHVPNLDRPAAL
jgi:sulfoxide reductase heme-binding subunit YedZ